MNFFQAEDGIRDAQESRGLGDVYKRQVYISFTFATVNTTEASIFARDFLQLRATQMKPSVAAVTLHPLHFPLPCASLRRFCFSAFFAVVIACAELASISGHILAM